MPRPVAWLFLVASLIAAPAQAAPLEAYGHLPSIEDVQITPDGKTLAYVTDVGGERTVVLYSIEKTKPIGGLLAGNQKLRDLRWADNDHLLITISSTTSIAGVIGPKREYEVTEVFDLSTGEQRPLISEVQDVLNVSQGVPISRTIEGHTVVFVHGIHFRDGEGVRALFKVDLESMRTAIVEPGTRDSEEWLLDDAGQVVAASEYDNDSKIWSLKVHRDDGWLTAYSVTAAIDLPLVLGITADGKEIELRVRDGDEISTVLVSLDGGPGGGQLGGEADLGDPVDDPASHRIIGSKIFADHTIYRFSQHDDQLAWNSVVHAFPGENVTLISWDADRKRVIVRVDGTRTGSEIQLIDLNTYLAHPLGATYPGISAADVADVKFIHYAAADGTSIPAFLTLPSGRPQKNLPLVVLPHGGPLARDAPGFDWWSQAIASRGYVVLQPEFRGSDGFGWKHAQAGFGEWGRKMQTDLSDGVRFLAEQGLIDPKRVCIVGGSYGGYAALAGPTLDRGVYRCSVSIAGISDPKSFLRWVDHRVSGSDPLPLRFWNRFMGVKDDDDPKLAEISPLVHAADADAPILLIHGTDDTVVPIAQSEDMEDALKAAGRPVSFVKLKSEDHWLSRSETREQMLAATVQFLEQYNPPN
jgi:dipeptidyl aminopeptidase/acylaminoacyl peptidase